MRKSCFSLKILFAAVATIGLALVACDDSYHNGSSIVDDEVEVFIDTTFHPTATTIDNEAVISRTITGLLGCVDAPGYGTLSSDFVTQFMPAIEMDTVGVDVDKIDSLKLVMRFTTDAFIGDSVAPMGIEVYPLIKDLPSPVYSNFDFDTYYDHNELLGKTIYTSSRQNESDSIKNLSYAEVSVKLPVSLGRKFYQQYKTSPETFSSPETFAKFFPGLYVKSSYGSGRITRMAKTTMDMYYHTVTKNGDNDTTIYNIGSYFAVTPEIAMNNNIALTMSSEIKERRARGEQLLVAPAGLDVEMVFPARELIAKYRSSIGSGLGVINSLDFSIPVELIANKYDITPPPYVLMVLKNKKDEFFAKNKTTDSKTSFYATYNSTSKTYSFGSMREYIIDLLEKDEITDDDITFVLTPVQVSTESSNSYYGSSTTYVTSITPYVYLPVMTRLLIDQSTIKFVYSRKTISM